MPAIEPATSGGWRPQVEAVGPRHRRPAASSSEDGEFVPQHDDFQVLEVVRPNAEDCQLQYPPKRHVAKREEHETSEPDTHSMRPSRNGSLRCGSVSRTRNFIFAPFTSTRLSVADACAWMATTRARSF